MFIEFQKITTAYPSRRSSVIVNADALLALSVDEFENKEVGAIYAATRVDVIGFPKYTFFTMTDLDVLAETINAVDVTSGFSSGISCDGGTVIDTVYPTVRYPFIKAPAIFNNTITETDNFIFNPNFMLYAENVIFNDVVMRSQQTALMIVLRDTAPTKIMSTLNYQDLFNMLQPTQV